MKPRRGNDYFPGSVNKKGAEAKTHNGQTRYETALIGKPPDQSRDRGHIAEAVTQTADHIIAEVQQGKIA